MMKKCLAKSVLLASWETQPIVRKIPGIRPWKKFIVFENNAVLVIKINTQTSNDVDIVFNIAKGFICDSTSLPWAYDNAGNAHDFGYAVQGSKHGYTRKFWDTVFKHLMQQEGFKPSTVTRRYWGVRLLARGAYKKRRIEKYQALRMQALNKIINKLGV